MRWLMILKACTFLSYVSLRWWWIRHAPYACPCPSCSAKQTQSHLSTSLPQGRSWGGGRGISAPHPSVKHFTMWLGAKPGLSSPWMRRTLRSAEPLAQFSTAPGTALHTPSLPPKLFHGAWLVGSHYCWARAAPEICCTASQSSKVAMPHGTTETHLLRKLCLEEESFFDVF